MKAKLVLLNKQHQHKTREKESTEMSSFISLDYLEMLEDAYEEYAKDCVAQGIEPLTRQEWYKSEWR